MMLVMIEKLDFNTVNSSAEKLEVSLWLHQSKHNSQMSFRHKLGVIIIIVIIIINFFFSKTSKKQESDNAPMTKCCQA